MNNVPNELVILDGKTGMIIGLRAKNVGCYGEKKIVREIAISIEGTNDIHCIVIITLGRNL